LKQADLRDIFIKVLQECLYINGCGISCISTVVVSPDHLSLSPTYSATKPPENTENEPDGPKLAAEGAIQILL
jgi:hypothetical protein